MTCGIYTITNTIDNRIYVGKSVDVEKRLMEHKYLLRNGTHPNLYLQNSYNKRGEGNFEFELLESYDEKVLLSMEYYWCTILGTFNRKLGYNLKLTDPNGKNRLSEETKRKIGDGNRGKLLGRTGFKHSEESKQKMSENIKGKRLGYKHSTETKTKMSNIRKGMKIVFKKRKPLTEETKAKIGNIHRGKKVSNETKEKMRVAAIGRKYSKDRNEKMVKTRAKKAISNGYYHSQETKDKIKKPILQYDLEGNFIKEWKGIIDIVREFGYSYASILGCVSGRKAKAHKFVWKKKS